MGVPDASPGEPATPGGPLRAAEEAGEAALRAGESAAANAETAMTRWLSARPTMARVVAACAGVIVKQSYYRLSLSAAGAAFWLVIAVFPAAFAAIMIFGLVVSPDDINARLERVTGTSSENLASVVAQQAQQVVATEPSRLSLGLAISLALTLWSASAGTYALMKSIRLAYGVPPQGYIVARMRGVVATLIAVVGVGILVWVADLLGSSLSDRSDLVNAAIAVVSAVATLAVLTLAVAATFRFALATPVPRRCLMPGAALTAGAIAVLAAGTALFGSYLRHFQATYGALTSVVVTLLVIYALMYAMLLAALFNALWAPLPAGRTDTSHEVDAQWQRISRSLDSAPTTSRPPSDTLPWSKDGQPPS